MSKQTSKPRVNKDIDMSMTVEEAWRMLSSDDFCDFVEQSIEENYKETMPRGPYEICDGAINPVTGKGYCRKISKYIPVDGVDYHDNKPYEVLEYEVTPEGKVYVAAVTRYGLYAEKTAALNILSRPTKENTRLRNRIDADVLSSFTLTPEQVSRITEWAAVQDKIWYDKLLDAVKSPSVENVYERRALYGYTVFDSVPSLTYAFGSTSIGQWVEVKHPTGEVLDVTDYENW